VRRFAALFVFVAACGPSPATEVPAPSGTLVIVIRQGADRVPFEPKVDRIRRANEQLAAILGHSIRIELDGSLLPQDHEGAQDVMARLLETVARDLDALKQHDPKALPFAASNFERLVVRYSPAEAAKRGRLPAVLDPATRTIDVVLDESRWLALNRGDISSPILRAFEGNQADRYAYVLPDQLPSNERSAWLDYQLHGPSAPPRPGQRLGSVDAIRVRGCVMLAKEGSGEARKYLLSRAFDDFTTTYHHQQAEVEKAPADSPFRRAESELVAWLTATLPSATPEERAHISRGLWVIDFRRTQSGERDPFAPFAFPNFDKMGFGFARADEGDHNPDFYRWALAAPSREDDFAKGLLQRKDPAFLKAAFSNAHTALRDENDYLRFLRRFESSPLHWRAGADVHLAIVYRPSPALLEEARRQWREVPIARPYALLYFARQADGSYHPDVEWPDMLQDRKPDDVILKDTLALGWPAFELVPVYWRQVQKTSARLGIVESAALELLGQDVRVPPGHKDIGGILAAIGRIDCDDDD
jgi:hypothetical protein